MLCGSMLFLLLLVGGVVGWMKGREVEGLGQPQVTKVKYVKLESIRAEPFQNLKKDKGFLEERESHDETAIEANNEEDREPIRLRGPKGERGLRV